MAQCKRTPYNENPYQATKKSGVYSAVASVFTKKNVSSNIENPYQEVCYLPSVNFFLQIDSAGHHLLIDNLGHKLIIGTI